MRVYSANLWVYNADVQAMRRSIDRMSERGPLLKEPVLFRVLGAGQ